jgi:hypothetical protein
MSQSDVHYTLFLVNHQTGQQIKIELIDPPFPTRTYRVRINGESAKKGGDAPVAPMVGGALNDQLPASRISADARLPLRANPRD